MLCYSLSYRRWWRCCSFPLLIDTFREGCRITMASCSPSPYSFAMQAPMFIPCAGSPRGWQDVKRKKGDDGKSNAMPCPACAFWVGCLFSSLYLIGVLYFYYWELCFAFSNQWAFLPLYLVWGNSLREHQVHSTWDRELGEDFFKFSIDVVAPSCHHQSCSYYLMYYVWWWHWSILSCRLLSTVGKHGYCSLCFFIWHCV